uniref:estradiol 17-beta-dehydrogenase 8-like n=1 Tax=Styela clava TaxID=7725 RepID=UPI00193A1D30|nr:estradiol 17-beta-dehydrogenase 8-like [Styela clava]
MAPGRLTEKAAIVTGGGSGIGRAVCEVFAREGASVAVLDINGQHASETVKLLLTNHQNTHCFIETDVSSVENVKEAFLKSQKELSKTCTILINCAGILRGDSFVNMKDDDFDDVIRVNLRGSFLTSREFLKSLENVEDSNGSIVNISSLVGKMSYFGQGSYCASKHGVLGITKTIAAEYPLHKIRCNAVLPGAIDTPMISSINPELLEQVRKTIPMGRIGKPEEVANACLFLASDESSYVNGACLEVTGGVGV